MSERPPHQLDQAIAAFLLDLLPPGRPRRLARMSKPGELRKDGTPRDKYQDIFDKQLTLAMLAEHVRGRKTYSYSLDKDGLARKGAIDVDAGGQPALLAALRAGAELGVTLFAVENDAGGAHKGGHVIALFDDFYPAAHINALMAAIAERAELGKVEIWPQNQGLRGLFGLHQLDQTRGNLLLQSGEIISLDTDLAAGFAAVQALPLNSAPPALVEPEQPAPQARPQTAKVISLVQPRRQQAGKIDTRAIFAEAIKRFNADNPHYISQSLTKGTAGNYFCECGNHSSGQAKIAVSFYGGIERGRSWSPDCTWFPSGDKNRYLDPFALYAIREHGGNDRAAKEFLARQYGLWVEPRKRQQEAPTPAPQPEQRSEAQRQAYNAQRRAQRCAETAQALDRIYNQVNLLDLTNAVPAGVEPAGHSDRAHLLFAYLHQRALDSGALQVAPTNEQLAADLQFCRRYVIYAFRELEAAGIGKRTGGKGGLAGQPNEAATWTFYRSPNLVCKPQQNAECTLSYIELDLDLTLEACERAPQPPAPEPLAEWECWQPAEWECSPYDLDLEAAPAVEPEQPALVEPAPAPGWRVVRLTGRWALRGPKAECLWFGSEGAALQALASISAPEQQHLVEPVGVQKSHIKTDQEAPAGPGADFNPAWAVPFTSEAYSGRVKDLQGFAEQWEAATSAIKPRQEATAAPLAQTLDLLDPRYAEQEDPQVRAAPVEPAAAARYWSLKGKLRKATSTKQIAWLRRQIADLEIWRPASEVLADRAGDGDARPSQARRACGPPPNPFRGQQASLFGGAD